MSTSIYGISDGDARANNITIARALDGKLLTKIVYPDPERDVQYGNAYHYRFFNRDASCLGDILELVKVLLHKPDCCLIRGVCKDDSLVRQRRLFHGDDATIIEQPCNWYALDVDKYGESSGDLRDDASRVLLALGLKDVEAFAIPSSGYLRKPGIRIRLFLWNSVKVSCAALKRHYSNIGVVDCALFHPIQPIYIARPIFNGMREPCNKLIAWLPGPIMCSEISPIYGNNSDRGEDKYTAKQARRFFDKFLKDVFDIASNRHDWLFGVSVALGKWIEQGLLDEEETIEELYLTTATWKGDRKRDMQTIVDGVKRGKQAMEF